ncbi:peptide deformylase [bacterium]|nr:peptide deformylase [bacterium]
MSILPLVTYPDPRLKFISEPVTTFNDELKQFVKDLYDTMYKEGGIGLAAVQVGRLQRILVLDIEQDERGTPVKPMVFINPEITWESEAFQTYKEGCLSFPGQYADVDRPDEIKLTYQTETGEKKEMHATGLMAICLQHELDHLNGITFTDHLSRMKRDMIHRKLLKEKRLTEV